MQTATNDAATPDTVFSRLSAAVLDRVGGNLALLRELITVFHDDCSRLLPDLQTALEQNDGAGVRVAAHTLKGMVSFFAATAATQAAYTLEKMGATGEFTSGQQEYLALVSEIQRLQASLTEICDGTGGHANLDCR